MIEVVDSGHGRRYGECRALVVGFWKALGQGFFRTYRLQGLGFIEFRGL